MRVGEQPPVLWTASVDQKAGAGRRKLPLALPRQAVASRDVSDLTKRFLTSQVPAQTASQKQRASTMLHLKFGSVWVQKIFTTASMYLPCGTKFVNASYPRTNQIMHQHRSKTMLPHLGLMFTL